MSAFGATVALGATASAHALAALSTQWSVAVFAAASFARTADVGRATAALVTPRSVTLPPQLVALTRRGGAVSFELFRRRYEWDASESCFRKVAFGTKDTFASYLAARGHSAASAALALQSYGTNSCAMPAPQFWPLLRQQMLAPFFCFQVFCVALWCLDEYWQYSLLTLAMLVFFEATIVTTRIKTLNDLRRLGAPLQPLLALRDGRWARLPPEELLPGDVVSVCRPSGAAAEAQVVPADLLLLQGSAIATEAALTGESTPVWKTPASDAPPGEALRLKEHGKASMLYSGTKVVQVTAPAAGGLRPPDGGAPALVLRTGFDSKQVCWF